MAMSVADILEIRINRVVDRFPTGDSGCGALAFIRHVKPVLQQGPQCGLVTLQMAASSLGLPSIDIEKVHETAKQMGFTNRGEMFSVEWLNELGQALWPALQGSVQSLPSAQELCSLLSDGCVLLVPYDCAKNHEPTINEGHSAHWCIVIGYVCRDDKRSELVWSNEEPTCFEDMHVLCLHGKSRHFAVWHFEELIASNANLTDIGQKRLQDEHTYVLPPQGAAALRNKCLVLSL